MNLRGARPGVGSAPAPLQTWETFVLAEIGYCHSVILSNVRGIRPSRGSVLASPRTCQEFFLGGTRPRRGSASPSFRTCGALVLEAPLESGIPSTIRSILPQRSSASAFVRTCGAFVLQRFDIGISNMCGTHPCRALAATSRRTCEALVLAMPMVRHSLRRSFEHARCSSLQRFRTGIPSSAPDIRPSRGSALTSPRTCDALL